MTMRNSLDPQAGNALLVNKILGSSYAVVKSVAEQLPTITYLGANVGGILTEIENLRTAVGQDSAAVTAAVVSATASQVSATASAGQATNSAVAANISKTGADASAVAAALSLTSIGDAVTNASASALISTSQATIAIASAVAAQTSETNSAASATSAESSLVTVQGILTTMNELYLGKKTVDPVLDNNGGALAVGAEYFNTTNNMMRVYTSTGWQDQDATAVTMAANATASASQASGSAAAAAASEINAGTSAASALGSKNAAAGSATDSAASSVLSTNWATQLVTPVNGIDFSSKYYAQAAQVSATAAEAAAATVTDAINGVILIEYANLAAFPGAGVDSKLYAALDTNKIYRWSGAAYVELSASPSNTDAIAEGATNLYFTPARATSAVTSVTGNAGTATKLATARTINGVNFDGSGNITVADATKVATTLVGAANGVATLGADGILSPAQRPTITFPVTSVNGAGGDVVGLATAAATLAKSGDTATGKMHFTATDNVSTALGNVTGAVNIDCSTADTYSFTVTGVTTLTFTNPPAAGKSQVVLMKVTNGGAFALNFQAGTKGITALGTLTTSGDDLLGVWYDVAVTKWVVVAIQKAVV